MTAPLGPPVRLMRDSLQIAHRFLIAPSAKVAQSLDMLHSYSEQLESSEHASREASHAPNPEHRQERRHAEPMIAGSSVFFSRSCSPAP